MRHKARISAPAALTGLVMLAGQAAAALPPLSAQKDINDSLFAVAMADHIRKTCASIDGRVIKALWQLNTLRVQATKLGYSADEVRAYIKDPDEKAAMRARGADYLKARGVREDDSAGICALGHDEIAKGSPIGALLIAK